MTVEIPGFPFPVRWQPDGAADVRDGALHMVAGPRTDRIHPANRDVPTDNAPALIAGMAGIGDYQLSARVTVDFAGDYDAGVLLLWAAPDRYAKLCFEYSPQQQPMAVGVVTRGTSDDANGFPVDGNTLWLRVARIGNTFAFHATTDPSFWHFVRLFDLGADTEPEVGFQVQSPAGEGCNARFTDISFVAETLVDIRDGS